MNVFTLDLASLLKNCKLKRILLQRHRGISWSTQGCAFVRNLRTPEQVCSQGTLLSDSDRNNARENVVNFSVSLHIALFEKTTNIKAESRQKFRVKFHSIPLNSPGNFVRHELCHNLQSVYPVLACEKSPIKAHDCLFNRLFRRRSKKTSKLRVTGLCAGIHRWPGNSPNKWPVTRKLFPFDDFIMKIEQLRYT